MSKVFVTGIGIISPIGESVKENLQSLREGKSGIDFSRHLDSRYKNVFKFGEIKYSNSELSAKLDFPIKGLTRACLLSFIAFDEAIKDAKITSNELSDVNTAFISASTVGGMCDTNQFYNDVTLESDTDEFVQSYTYSNHTSNIVKHYKIKGFTDTINTACSSSANSIMLGYRLIKSGRANRVIVGGVDALSKFSVNGFASLNILSKSECKPFDKNRDGLTLGEASAYIVLESENIIKNKNKYAQIIGYGNSNDAFHTSSISEEATGILESIEQSIRMAKIEPKNIDYINAHGTATLNNDYIELVSYNKIFGKVPLFNSTKSYTGHTLGAAGAVEAIYSILSIKNNEIYASLNFTDKIEEFNCTPIIKNISNKIINTVLTNSYGFNGSCTSLIFTKS